MLSSREIDVGPLFVDAMVTEGKIDSAEFSFAMNGLDTDYSHLDIGAPQGNRVKGGLDAMVRIPMFNDFFWSQNWQGVWVDENNPEEAYHTYDTYTIIDTGSSHMFLPSTIFMPLVNVMVAAAGDPDYAV